MDEKYYRNVLMWIRTIAGMHYFGDAFDPEHMRNIGNMAAKALDGKEFPDFGAEMAEAKRGPGKWLTRLASSWWAMMMIECFVHNCRAATRTYVVAGCLEGHLREWAFCGQHFRAFTILQQTTPFTCALNHPIDTVMSADIRDIDLELTDPGGSVRLWQG